MGWGSVSSVESRGKRPRGQILQCSWQTENHLTLFFGNLVMLAPRCHTFRHDVADARIDCAGFVFVKARAPGSPISRQAPGLRSNPDSTAQPAPNPRETASAFH